MSGEEAVNIIKECKEKGFKHTFYTLNDYHTALDMAIKALEQEPKTGHWILLDECSNSGYYCSECHKKVVKEGWSETVKKIKFCPNCGIKILPQPCKEESEV